MPQFASAEGGRAAAVDPEQWPMRVRLRRQSGEEGDEQADADQQRNPSAGPHGRVQDECKNAVGLWRSAVVVIFLTMTVGAGLQLHFMMVIVDCLVQRSGHPCAGGQDDQCEDGSDKSMHRACGPGSLRLWCRLESLHPNSSQSTSSSSSFATATAFLRGGGGRRLLPPAFEIAFQNSCSVSVSPLILLNSARAELNSSL
jgi:hypothetical protein